MEIDHNFYMSLALREAWSYQYLTYPNPAVGACVVDKSGAILSIEAHKEAGKPHAEVLALKSAYLKLTNNREIDPLTQSSLIHEYLIVNHKNIFQNCTIYTTLEPCNHHGKTPPCAHLLGELGLKSVIIGSSDESKIAGGGGEYLKSKGIDTIFGVMKKECDELLWPFLIWQKRSFVVAKWAQRLNGTIDGGYISSNESLRRVHAIREKLDLLIIGGNTVRIDRPTLDSRLVGTKAPDVMILSRSVEFDKSIPIFGVQNRNILISKEPKIPIEKGIVMIEGGGEIINSFYDKIDHFMCFVSPKSGGNMSAVGLDLRFIHEQRSDDDLLFYAKKECE